MRRKFPRQILSTINMTMKLVLTTGGFDPIHSGHISYLKSAKQLGDKLVVGLNSNEWLSRKKGRPFLSLDERRVILSELSCVDDVIEFDDADDTACDAITKVLQLNKNNAYSEIIFANGGDRGKDNTPEEMHFENEIVFLYGVGGNTKQNSSSWLLDRWKTQKTEREWGYWRVLDDRPEKGYKLKELVIYPGKSLSDQRHFKRQEQWIVLEGVVKMKTEYQQRIDTIHLTNLSTPYSIGKEVWHCANNPEDTPTHILEIQRGTECIEEDIERR